MIKGFLSAAINQEPLGKQGGLTHYKFSFIYVITHYDAIQLDFLVTISLVDIWLLT